MSADRYLPELPDEDAVEKPLVFGTHIDPSITLPLDAKPNLGAFFISVCMLGLFTLACCLEITALTGPRPVLQGVPVFAYLWVSFITFGIFYLFLFFLAAFLATVSSMLGHTPLLRLDRDGLHDARCSGELIEWRNIASYTRSMGTRTSITNGLRLQLKRPVSGTHSFLWRLLAILSWKRRHPQSIVIITNGLSVSRHVLLQVMETMIERSRHV